MTAARCEYGETDDAVTILRIVHGRRRITGKSLLSLSSLADE